MRGIAGLSRERGPIKLRRPRVWTLSVLEVSRVRPSAPQAA
jgi:hypothetical protein